MSIITAAYDDKNHTAAMAADSFTNNTSGVLRIQSAPKILHMGALLIGTTGLSLLNEAVEDFEPSWRPKGIGAVRKWTRELADHTRKWLDDRGHGEALGGVKTYDCTMLVASPWGLVSVDPAMAVMVVREDFAAIGAGCDVAFGAMALLSGGSMAIQRHILGEASPPSVSSVVPSKIAHAGATIAAKYAIHCAPPIQVDVVSLENID